MAGRRTPKRRPATPEEFKAMAHPLRLRILRLCLHEPLTNRQIADQLGKDPATVLHHVRRLVDTEFLRAERPRTGTRGALEKPYRATGKSWQLSVERFPADRRLLASLAMVDAFRAEFERAGAEGEVMSTRVGLRLSQSRADELRDRLHEVIEEFVERGEDPDGDRYGLFLGIHRRAP